MHASLAQALPALVLVHVLSAFAFVLVHGPSVFALWALRRERDPARVAALLDASRAASSATWAASAAVGTTGLLLAAIQHAWRLSWVWGSIALFVLLAISMSLLGARPFNHARHALGLRWFDGSRSRAPTGVVDAAALEDALRMVRARAPALMATGLVGLAALVLLMVAKPVF